MNFHIFWQKLFCSEGTKHILIRQCFALDSVLSKRNVQSKTLPNRYLLFVLSNDKSWFWFEWRSKKIQPVSIIISWSIPIFSYLWDYILLTYLFTYCKTKTTYAKKNIKHRVMDIIAMLWNYEMLQTPPQKTSQQVLLKVVNSQKRYFY